MNIRNILLLAGLAAFMAGCVIHPRPYPPRYYDNPYDDGYYDYRGTPSYEGYYYARIIFISNVPYYVDDDRRIRPIPPRLHDHFRRYSYNTLARPPVFSRDREVRDGYPVSSIIYLDGVPYHVGNDRKAQPLPERLRPRFRYTPSNQGSAPAHDNRPQHFDQRDNGRNNEQPAFNQNQGNDRNRDEHGQNERDRNRLEQPPPFDRGQREGVRDAPADTNGRTTPSPEPRSPFLRQAQPDAGGSQADTTNSKIRSIMGNRQQAIDDLAKKKTDKKEAAKKDVAKKESGNGKKDKKGESTQADDNSGNNKDNAKKSRNGKDDDQGGNDRGNGFMRQ
jgi:hypothetical protein